MSKKHTLVVSFSGGRTSGYLTKKLLEEKEIKILEEKIKSLSEGKEVIINNIEEEKFLSNIGLLTIKPKICH